jgi:topoisomerase-4 subunit A
MTDEKITVANVVGQAMQFHPHGDQSIFSALINLANKDLLLERQGNFGNPQTGDAAAAARYIECRLTPIAREVLFNKELTPFADSYDSRDQEPVVLPAKVPILLAQGAEGIAVGMERKCSPTIYTRSGTRRSTIYGVGPSP